MVILLYVEIFIQKVRFSYLKINKIKSFHLLREDCVVFILFWIFIYRQQYPVILTIFVSPKPTEIYYWGSKSDIKIQWCHKSFTYKKHPAKAECFFNPETEAVTLDFLFTSFLKKSAFRIRQTTARFDCALFVVEFSPTGKASLCVGSITILHKKRGLAKSQPPFLWRRGWDVLSLSSKHHKLSHGFRGFENDSGKMAERVGFEPTVQSLAHRLSRSAP